MIGETLKIGASFHFLPQNLSYEMEGHPMDLSIFRHPIILTVEPIIIVPGFYPTDGGLTGHTFILIYLAMNFLGPLC